jgi:hypothetical protein
MCPPPQHYIYATCVLLLSTFCRSLCNRSHMRGVRHCCGGLGRSACFERLLRLQRLLRSV